MRRVADVQQQTEARAGPAGEPEFGVDRNVVTLFGPVASRCRVLARQVRRRPRRHAPRLVPLRRPRLPPLRDPARRTRRVQHSSAAPADR